VIVWVIGIIVGGLTNTFWIPLGLLRCVVHYFLLDDVYQLDALVGNTRAETLRPGHEFYGHVKYWTEVRFSAVKH
jgi:hypothetical protein